MFLLAYVLSEWEMSKVDTFTFLLYTERFDRAEDYLRGLKGEMDPLLSSVLKMALIYLYMSDNNTDYRYDEFTGLLGRIAENQPRNTPREKMLVATALAMGAVFFGKRGNIPKALSLGKEAFDLYRKAYAMDTSVHDALLPMGLYEYAMGYLTRSRERKDRGIEKIKRAMEKGSIGKPLAYIGIVYVYVFDNRPGRGVYYAKKALRLYPESRTFRWVLAYAYLKSGQYDKAYGVYEEIVRDIRRRNPSCKVCIAEAYYYMGESLYEKGDRVRAKKLWYRSLLYLRYEKDRYRTRKVKELRSTLRKKLKDLRP